MSNISVWVLSVTGIVLFGCTIDIIMPNGQLAKYIKSTLCIATVFVIVSPIIDMIGKKDFGELFVSDIVIDEDLLYSINKSKQLSLQNQLVTLLEESGYKDVNIDIAIDYEEKTFVINNIFVDLSRVVLNENIVNIDKYTNIKKLIGSVIDIEEESILFYG